MTQAGLELGRLETFVANHGAGEKFDALLTQRLEPKQEAPTKNASSSDEMTAPPQIDGPKLQGVLFARRNGGRLFNRNSRGLFGRSASTQSRRR